MRRVRTAPADAPRTSVYYERMRVNRQPISIGDAADWCRLAATVFGRRLLAGDPFDDRQELIALREGLVDVHLEDADSGFGGLQVDVGIEQARERLQLERLQEMQ